MKRNLFTLVLAAFISVVSFTACSKNADKPNIPGKSMKDKLIGSYKMTALTLLHKEGTVDLLDHMNACDRDNLYVLKADMTSAVLDAGETCSPSSDDTGTWNLPNDNTIVIDEQAYKIESMDGTTLRMSAEITEEGETATVKMTYVKQ